MTGCDDILRRLDTIEKKNDTAHKEMSAKLGDLGVATAVDDERIEETRRRCDERYSVTTKVMFGLGGTLILGAAGLVFKALVA